MWASSHVFKNVRWTVTVSQALEQSYNKTAKVKDGIIGVTVQKTTFSNWNLIKHKKMQYIKVLHDYCGMSHNDESSLHHEYSETKTAHIWSTKKILKHL